MPVAERPLDTAYNETDKHVRRVYTNMRPTSAQCWFMHFLGPSSYWPAPQITGVHTGTTRAAAMYNGLDASWSYPDGTWKNYEDTYKPWTHRKRHDFYNPRRRAQWTAPQAWDNVALLFVTHDAYDQNTSLSLSGSGNLLKETVDSRTTGDWAGSHPTEMKWLLVATGVAQGDVLTISPTAAIVVMMAGVVCWNTATERITTSNEAMTLDIMRLRSAQIPSNKFWGIQIANELVGQTLALKVKDDLNAATFWGSGAHCTSDTMKLHTATTTWYYKPPGGSETTWTPSAGDRVEGEYFKIVSSGTATIFGSDVGAYEQTITIDDTGAKIEWSITWNATAVANGVQIVGGHSGMFSVDGTVTFFDYPGVQGKTALELDDNSETPSTDTDVVRLYGPVTFSQHFLKAVHTPTAWATGTKMFIQQRSDTTNKWYNILSPYYLTPYDAVEDGVSDGEYRLLVREFPGPIDHEQLYDADEVPGIVPGTTAGVYALPSESVLILLHNATDTPAHILFNASDASAAKYDLVLEAGEMMQIPSLSSQSASLGGNAPGRGILLGNDYWSGKGVGVSRLSIWMAAGAGIPSNAGRPVVVRSQLRACPPSRILDTAPRATHTYWNETETRWEVTLDQQVMLTGSPAGQFTFSGGSGTTPATAVLETFDGEYHRLYLSGGGLDGTETHLNYATAANGTGITGINGYSMAALYKLAI